ncbi:hypothetical protein A2U01_0101575, partial [Trifolium medium]|nr:hypothetical protein [Trifolium medium]
TRGGCGVPLSIFPLPRPIFFSDLAVLLCSQPRPVRSSVDARRKRSVELFLFWS